MTKNTGNFNNRLYYDYLPSLTNNAAQKFNIPTTFPCCPQNIITSPLQDYLKNLEADKLFAENEYYKARVIKAGIYENNTLLVECKSIKNDGKISFSIFKIIYDNDLFIHMYIKQFDTIDLAEKFFEYYSGRIPFDENDFDLFEFEYL